jgi:hypothetical protein
LPPGRRSPIWTPTTTASVIISLFQTMFSPDQAALSRRLATGRAVVRAIPGAVECNRTSK